jgi:hypothetical protein
MNDLPMPRIAALFVESHGVYSNVAHVELWDKTRDARSYTGPWPVVAHPPCERWGHYATGGPKAKRRFVVGDDAGCFAAALEAVRRYGGVLEHPEASKAWQYFGILKPPFDGGWVAGDWQGGWTCCLDQGHYGHRAQKTTWLYACHIIPPFLRWGRSRGKAWIGTGFNRPGAFAAAKAAGWVYNPLNNLSKKERIATPVLFRDVLVTIARSCYDVESLPWKAEML